jgi:hypothetical protein
MGSDFVRILDYKTGNVGTLSLDEKKDFYLNNDFSKKEVFQLLCYGYLYLKNNPDNKNLKLAICSFKDLNKSFQYVRKDDGDLDKNDFKCFETFLVNIFKQIFDKNIDFVKTDNRDNCRYCLYRFLCLRS